MAVSVCLRVEEGRFCVEVEGLCWREEGFGTRLIFCSSSTEDIKQNRSSGGEGSEKRGEREKGRERRGRGERERGDNVS